MKIQLKRAYDEPDSSDGFRVLVDRLWPRGKKKEALRLDLWAKALSPSTELRKWFGHDPSRWPEFRQRYLAELKTPEKKDAIDQLLQAARGYPVLTLVYGAKDTEHNEAVVLQSFLEGTVKKAHPARSK